jgi:phosphatidylserine/phosphatidylglycerophosphate/cardiolipin synthase-like enzyme
MKKAAEPSMLTPRSNCRSRRRVTSAAVPQKQRGEQRDHHEIAAPDDLEGIVAGGQHFRERIHDAEKGQCDQHETDGDKGTLGAAAASALHQCSRRGGCVVHDKGRRRVRNGRRS